ncbi:MAG: hypothetical protein IPJ32_01875 [Sphingobacteriaceae bacterium]|nr:hypothetical protein [Sphingobacteriaceae bacterium]
MMFVFHSLAQTRNHSVFNNDTTLVTRHNRIFQQYTVLKKGEYGLKLKSIGDGLGLLGIIQRQKDTAKIKLLTKNYRILRKYKATSGVCAMFSGVCFVGSAFYSFQLWNSGIIKMILLLVNL